MQSVINPINDINPINLPSPVVITKQETILVYNISRFSSIFGTVKRNVLKWGPSV